MGTWFFIRNFSIFQAATTSPPETKSDRGMGFWLYLQFALKGLHLKNWSTLTFKMVAVASYIKRVSRPNFNFVYFKIVRFRPNLVCTHMDVLSEFMLLFYEKKSKIDAMIVQSCPMCLNMCINSPLDVHNQFMPLLNWSTIQYGQHGSHVDFFPKVCDDFSNMT